MSTLSEEPPHPRALSWERAPLHALLKLAGPMTLSGLSFAVMGMVDTLLVGALGAAELAGVGLGIVVTNGLMGFGFGVLRGVKVLLAQARGGRADARARVYVGAGLLVALWLGCVMMVLGGCAALLVPGLAASPEAGAAAQRYIAVRALGMPIILAYVALREARYGYGETRSALVSAVIGNLLHALLDYVALYQLGWGAAGAACANVLAFSLQLGLLIVAQRESGFQFGPQAFAAQAEVLRAGAFTGLQFALEIGALAALSLLLAGVSDRDMAAHQIAVQLAAFCFLPALAIAEAATLLVAEAYGSGRDSLVSAVAREARKLALYYALACALLLLAGGDSMAREFTDDRALIALLERVFVAVAAHQLFEALALAGHAVLRGVGKTRVSALCALSCAWLCTPTLGYLLVHGANLGVLGAWVARAVELLCAALFLWRYVGRRPWQRSSARQRFAQPVLTEQRPSIA